MKCCACSSNANYSDSIIFDNCYAQKGIQETKFKSQYTGYITITRKYKIHLGVENCSGYHTMVRRNIVPVYGQQEIHVEVRVFKPTRPKLNMFSSGMSDKFCKPSPHLDSKDPLDRSNCEQSLLTN